MNPYAVNYGLARAWIYSMLGVGALDGVLVLHDPQAVRRRDRAWAATTRSAGRREGRHAVDASFWVLCAVWLALFALLVLLGGVSSD